MRGTATATAKNLSANDVSHLVIKAALKVHSALGPGLLESAYEACLVHELRKSGLRVHEWQVSRINHQFPRVTPEGRNQTPCERDKLEITS
ncbi:MAG: GxxExxY protein [Acidobacteriales bacterium]|nr:GxxExxY protein [Terriglobales bacterium]